MKINMLILSRRFREAIKIASLDGTPQYKLAAEERIAPSQLSAMLRGIVPVRRDDPRLRNLAHRLGIPVGEAFEEFERATLTPAGVEFRDRRQG